MSFRYQDVARSFLEHIRASDHFVGESVFIDTLDEPTSHLSSWYEVHVVSLIPDAGRVSMQTDRGTIRVLCRSRTSPQAEGDSDKITVPFAMVDRVKDAIRWQDIEIKDWSDGIGGQVTGTIHCDEIQVDDIGEAEDHVRTVLCTARVLLSAA